MKESSHDESGKAKKTFLEAEECEICELLPEGFHKHFAVAAGFHSLFRLLSGVKQKERVVQTEQHLPET